MMVVRKIWWDGDQIHTEEVPLDEVYLQEKDMEIKNEITRNKDYCFVVEPNHTLMDIARWLLTLTDPSEMKYCLDKAEKEKDSMDTMDFGDALAALKAGSKVARNGWNGKGMWLELQMPDEYSHMTLPYVYLNYPEDAQNTPGARVPWLASQTDMLAEDWRLFD